jgi:hypothetical protein
MQSFCVERDLFYTTATGLFGPGPWLPLYFLAGLAGATLGTFLLLRRRHGDGRAAMAAVLANLWNVYALLKYPEHFNLSVLHWTTLSIVCDFVIVERVVERRGLSLEILAWRTLFLLMSFGQELGHVLGYSLTSLLFSGLFVVAVAVRRYRRGEPLGLVDPARSWAVEWREQRGRFVAIGAVTLAAAFFIVPIVAQIVMASRAYDFGARSGEWWYHPARLFVPWMRGIESPIQIWFQGRLGALPKVVSAPAPACSFWRWRCSASSTPRTAGATCPCWRCSWGSTWQTR